MRDTIDLIREAGFKEHNGLIYVTTINDDCAKEIERFVEFVRADAIAHERKACAYRAGIALLGADRGLANRIDQAIRARGENT
jgi:hypothetical protein